MKAIERQMHEIAQKMLDDVGKTVSYKDIGVRYRERFQRLSSLLEEDWLDFISKKK